MILFIDDEKRYIAPYVNQLQQSHQVQHLRKIGDALEYFEQHSGEVELLILDIMMPPGATFGEEETHDGLYTGIYFFEWVRNLLPGLPIIILTNVTEEQVERMFEAKPNCYFFRKRYCLPHELNQKVEEILTRQGGDK